MMKKFDKRVVTIILLLIAGILICVYAIESRASVLFILISIIPFVIANRLLFFWDNWSNCGYSSINNTIYNMTDKRQLITTYMTTPYELTRYVNDINREHTQVLMEYAGSGPGTLTTQPATSRPSPTRPAV